ncbi:MAG: hypothetical protein IJ715_05440 [Bacilli bacterium]|nr:hypothetical protein [Bacilli bacterium]MBR1937110.1 hypothetical protein [Bacilli bacterium]
MQRRYLFMVLIILLLSISLGYALLSTNLNIVGTTVVKDNKWDIYFDNVQVKSGSVTASTPAIDTAKTTVSYSVNLNLPGDYFEFTVDAKNAGTIDGMISAVSSKLNSTEITTLPNYLEYSVSYSDGVAIQNNHLLEAGKTETYKVRVGYKKDISATDLPSTEQTLNLTFSVTYVQADDNAVKPGHPESFETDSWDTIVNAVKTGNASVYNVGDTKTVDMRTLGTHTLRIANTSTPTECSTTGFSQTACGFVLEFADIITKHNMNPSGEYKGTTYNYGWNVDGWPASSMRTYVNTDIYNALPTELKNGIIDTTIVSGHGITAGETNFTSTDKLYLLSTHEVWEDVDGDTSSGIDHYDTAYNNTRQLDYYKGLNVTTSSYSGVIK